MDDLETRRIADDVDLIAPETKLDRALAGAQILQREVRQPVGQVRVDVDDLRGAGGVYPAEDRDQAKDRGRGPCLRHVGPEIGNRIGARLARHARPEFRQAVMVEALGRREDALGDLLCLGVPARPPEAAGDGGIVVRPDRSEVVGVGIVGGMLHRERADPPAAPHVGLHQPVDHAVGAIGRDDAAGEAVPPIGRNRSDGPLLPVEPEIVGALLLPPEALVEVLVEAGGSLPQFARARGIAPDLVCLRHPQQRVEGIALQLAQSNRQRRDRAVLVPDSVVRILPALVIETDRRAGLVLLEPVTVAVAVLQHPLERSLGVRPVAVEDLFVAGPLVGVGKHDQEQQRGIGRPVVRREGQESEAGQLPITQLVRDLARFFVLFGIVVGRLHAREAIEGAEGELGKAADAFHRDHQ